MVARSGAVLDAAIGADGRCQVNNRLRLVQEASGWLDDIFSQCQSRLRA